MKAKPINRKKVQAVFRIAFIAGKDERGMAVSKGWILLRFISSQALAAVGKASRPPLVSLVVLSLLDRTLVLLHGYRLERRF